MLPPAPARGGDAPPVTVLELRRLSVEDPRANADDPMQRAETVRAAIGETPVGAAGVPIPVTVSIGVAMLDRHRRESADRWLAAADAALYVAKRAGRNRVTLAGRRGRRLRGGGNGPRRSGEAAPAAGQRSGQGAQR